MSSRRFYLDNHGCAKNQVDGEEIAARLEAEGWTWSASAEEADLVIVNSCGFIEDAKKESIDAVIGWKSSLPGKRVILAGCLAQRYANELAEALPEADGIVGNAELSDVVEAAGEVLGGGRPVLMHRPESALAPSAYRRPRLLDFPGTAHVKITEGCSNGCSYCAIPLIRGSLRSRSVKDVAEECAWLVSRGARELVLIGQDLGSYGKDSEGRALLPDLLRALSDIEGAFRVRTLYIHPDHFPLDILPVIASDPRLLPYFDLPFQHASAPVLRAMNRKGDAGTYFSLVRSIRGALPDSIIRSTFLVGFPGETEADFAALRAFQDEARLDWLGAFAYSREEGTAAYGMKGRVPKKAAAARKAAVEEAQERITADRLARFVGRELEVLVEERLEKPQQSSPAGTAADAADGDAEEFSLGRAWPQAPDVDGLCVLRGEAAPGSVVRARVLAVTGVDFDCAILR